MLANESFCETWEGYKVIEFLSAQKSGWSWQEDGTVVEGRKFVLRLRIGNGAVGNFCCVQYNFFVS